MEIEFSLSVNFFNNRNGKSQGYQRTSITLILTHPVDLFLIPYFSHIFTNFRNEADCLSIDSIIDRYPK